MRLTPSEMTCLHLVALMVKRGSVELAGCWSGEMIMSGQMQNTREVEWLFMRDFQNAFDAALAGKQYDWEVMGTSVRRHPVSSPCGEVHGVLTILKYGFAGSGIRIEGSSNPSLFVRTGCGLCCGVATR